MRHFLTGSSTIIVLFGIFALSTTPAMAQKANAQPGKMLFLRCAACHSLSASAPAKVGPHLQGIVGRKSASVEGFAYSPAMRSAKLTWNEATLDKWLAKPRSVVPSTTMAFAGISDPAQRMALIAYLKKPMP